MDTRAGGEQRARKRPLLGPALLASLASEAAGAWKGVSDPDSVRRQRQRHLRVQGVADGELLDAEAVDPERLGRRRVNRAAELRERARLELWLARL
jgi:hypothetical protein